MINQENYCPRLDPFRLLQMLQSGNAHQQYEALLVACPCRNRYYDQEVWSAICQVRATTPEGRIRDRANHVMNTLYERARLDMRWVHLLHWLTEQGYALFVPPWLQKQVGGRNPWAGVHLPRVTLGDVPALIEVLASEDPDDRETGLQALCPGASRPYHRKVWLALFHACHGEDRALAAQAQVATRRLLHHAASDPHAQRVLLWLHQELCAAEPGEPADVVEALLATLERPLGQAAKSVVRKREDPALRGNALVEVAPLIEAAYGSENPRELRKALHALRKTEDPCALSIIAEYLGHPEPTIGTLARNLLGPLATT